MKLINADIKTEEEMYHRMVDSEVFYYDNNKVKFENGQFKAINKSGFEQTFGQFRDRFKDFMIEQSFENALSSPDYNPLCWVSDLKVGVRINIRRIVAYDHKSEGYIDVSGNSWSYATPVETNELTNSACVKG